MDLLVPSFLFSLMRFVLLLRMFHFNSLLLFLLLLLHFLILLNRSNAQAMAAALLLMGISYFLVCLLGVGLLKRHGTSFFLSFSKPAIL